MQTSKSLEQCKETEIILRKYSNRNFLWWKILVFRSDKRLNIKNSATNVNKNHTGEAKDATYIANKYEEMQCNQVETESQIHI